MIAEQQPLPGLPHPGDVPGPLVHDFFHDAPPPFLCGS
jgi:hypothetical protein